MPRGGTLFFASGDLWTGFARTMNNSSATPKPSTTRLSEPERIEVPRYIEAQPPPPPPEKKKRAEKRSVQPADPDGNSDGGRGGVMGVGRPVDLQDKLDTIQMEIHQMQGLLLGLVESQKALAAKLDAFQMAPDLPPPGRQEPTIFINDFLNFDSN
ncbi:hypothetical protein BC830DRAFT_1081338 [Chytriomyces sp. MP71]|nr:hypothetical protein BC830DRAFT_1081338 [Chytriomyces sp. MP71]